MIFKYIPTGTVIIDGIISEFGESRSSIRTRLRGTHREDNQVIQIGDGDSISQRRDIYTDFNSKENYFFLIYNDHDLLTEVEIHHCQGIKIMSAEFDFDNNLDEIAEKLSAFSPVIRQSNGEIFGRELKVVLMSKAQMGGDDDTLGYFYCASDVSHLDEEVV
ncbi:hypothetical protein ACFOTA_17770 [Chitinophaga sp. GCM10012297]|uniref:Uncharacterized protein n=1 Tax=Chitinophaga chungangae TaxID=2821488 RepID=A0ABS3YHC2_9BACT|nr:hypothetical protein [Chitinophaga chungangae]MBO9154072.1 hypothetical protein [Chitinophaga chungangae]